MKQSAANQQLLTEQMRQFVDDFRKLVTDEQTKIEEDNGRRHRERPANGRSGCQGARGLSLRGRRYGKRSERQACDQNAGGPGVDGSVRRACYSATLAGRLTRRSSSPLQTKPQMTEQVRAFIAEAQQRSGEEMAKSRQAMDESVGRVMAQLSGALQQMEDTRKTAAFQEQSRNDQLTSRTHELVSTLRDQVERLLSIMAEQVVLTQRNIESIGSVATRAIDGMNSGALNMGSAAQRFETAGASVTGVFERSAKVSEQASPVRLLRCSPLRLQCGKASEQYENTRRTVDTGVATLTALIENAKKEAGVLRVNADGPGAHRGPASRSRNAEPSIP